MAFPLTPNPSPRKRGEGSHLEPSPLPPSPFPVSHFPFPVSRFPFTLVVPVADRPRQLAACIASLRQLLAKHPCPGQVSLLIAEDSHDPAAIAAHQQLAEGLQRDGIPAHHLAADEQRALVAALPLELQMRLESVLGSSQRARWHHKGASVTRNIAYLWLARHRRGPDQLFWFFDSDQTFLQEIDYFGALNRIFSETATQILTGKVVGDPPVSPAVMAGTLLDDLIAFVTELASLTPDSPCAFHTAAAHASQAAYHDMADLFGFAAKPPFRYACEREGAHDHHDCLETCAAQLAAFFDGVHPTRHEAYAPADAVASLTPARTLYTGNFVMRAEGLRWFIPFAPLRLRMAGPTLGRIIQAEVGDAFASANLPMLHRRAEAEIGASEFRPGVNKESELIDISGEFERQYYGDGMLFSMRRMVQDPARYCPDGRSGCRSGCRSGFSPTSPQTSQPAHPYSSQINSAEVVMAVEAEMQARYRTNQQRVGDKIEALSARLDDLARLWRSPIPAAMTAFLAHLRHNFGTHAPVWSRIGDPAQRATRCAEISAAIDRYPQERQDWQTALKDIQP